VLSDVQQSSHLGSLLFNINDISSCFKNCKFLLFADDLKLYSKVSSHDECDLIQEDCVTTMKLNAGKCCSRAFSRQRLTDYTYVVNSSILKIVSFYFSFFPHNEQIIENARIFGLS